MAEGERVAKRLARAGLASRREAERLIAEGRVAVNGETLESPAFNVTPADVVTLDGERIPEAEGIRLWRFHKPAGILVTRKDDRGRKTVFDMLDPTMPHVVAVGRLDLNSEGLLLLTNDGDLARHMELPETAWKRRYRVRLYGTPRQKMIEELARGITVEGIAYGAIEARIDSQQGANAWLTLALREGKNREVRRVLEHYGLKVNRLLRVGYGPFELGSLDKGKTEEVRGKQLREQLGPPWAERVAHAHRRRPA